MTQAAPKVAEPEEADALEILESTGALVPVDSEVSTMIATAKRFPRSIARSRKLALAMATMDEETAASCFYNLPRSGKRIEGPSARLAEIIAMSWGNVRFGAEVLDNDAKDVRSQGMCWDLESNVAFQVKVKRRITDKSGRTYNDDMIVTTGNAANSIAMRNAVLKVIPTVFWKPIYDAARKVAIGDATTLAARRGAALDYFTKLGVTEEQVCRALDVGGVEEIGLDELVALTGLRTAIKEGDTTIDEAFGDGGDGGGSRAQPRRKSDQKPPADDAAAKADLEAKAAEQRKKLAEKEAADAKAAADKAAADAAAGAGSAASSEGGKQEPAGDEGHVTDLGGGSKIVHPPKTATPAASEERPIVEHSKGAKPDFELVAQITKLTPKVDAKLGKGESKRMLSELYSVNSAVNLAPDDARAFIEVLQNALAEGVAAS